MSDWFKTIACPNCNRMLRYSQNTANTPTTCFGCNHIFVPSAPIKSSATNHPGVEKPTDAPARKVPQSDGSVRSAALPRWARRPPKAHSRDTGSSTGSTHDAGDINSSWATGDASVSGADGGFSGFGVAEPPPQASHGGRKTLVIGGMALVVLFIFGVIFVANKAPIQPVDSTSDAHEGAAFQSVAPLGSRVVAVLSHESEIFAIEEYCWTGLTAGNDEDRRPHAVVGIPDLKASDRVRVRLECKKYPELLNADQSSMKAHVESDGSMQSQFPVWIPWNTTELTNATDRDPMIEMGIETFVNESSVLKKTLRIHFNEIFVMPNDEFWLAVAYVQPDHAEIRALRDRYAKMDLNWDWVALEKSTEEVIGREIREEIADADEAADGIAEECAEMTVSSKSILRTYFVWKLVDSLGIRYQNLPKDSAAGRRPAQRLRTVSEVLRTKMGNCIEESILIASLIQEDVSLISPPGHCLAMIGSPFAFFEAIPLECTALGRDIDIATYKESLQRGGNAHSQSGLGRLVRTLQVMPPKMRSTVESDPSWRNFAAAIEMGSEQLGEVFDQCAVLRAWTQARKLDPPFPEAIQTDRMTSEEREALFDAWKAQAEEMLEWFQENDSNYEILIAGMASGDRIQAGLAYWYLVCLIVRSSDSDLVARNYVPISTVRRMGVAPLPNESGTAAPRP